MDVQMPMLVLAAVQYGGYVSPLKLLVAVALFFAWLPLTTWIYKDAQEVRTNYAVWTNVMLVTGVIALAVLLLAPLFLIGLPIALIGLATVSIAYIIHRNARVSDFEKVLTFDHVKSLFVNEQKKMDKATRGISFVTANGNDVPLPAPKTQEALAHRISCELFDDALWRRASDVVFQPGAQQYAVTYFVDGMAMKQNPRSREEVEAFIHYLKHIADLDTEERRKPQVGKFKVVKDDQSHAWEVMTAGSTAGEQLKITRHQDYGAMRLEHLGLTENQLESMQELRGLQQGLVLLTGPKKSGITTTLYAALRNHDPFMNNINTLEKKPMADMQNITQHVWSMSDSTSGEGGTYAKKLQSVLRMGPDIIGVADVEDAQTAYLSCAAVREGLVVYPTMEATGVMQAMTKWLKLVDNRDLIAETLAAIVNQRLVRILCDECKQAYQPDPNLLRKFNIPADKIKVLYRPGEVEYDKHGKPILCEKCQGTGFYGRTAVFETVFITDPLREAIRKAKSVKEMAAYFRKAGMLYLQEQSIKKVAQGVTSINEVIRHFSTKEQQPAQKTQA